LPECLSRKTGKPVIQRYSFCYQSKQFREEDSSLYRENQRDRLDQGLDVVREWFVDEFFSTTKSTKDTESSGR